jgi:hypothetical protein
VAGLADLREALQSSALPMAVEAHDWSQLPASFRIGIERRHLVIVAGRREEALARDWLRDEEAAAWAHLQGGK